jgi:TonB family protein
MVLLNQQVKPNCYIGSTPVTQPLNIRTDKQIGLGNFSGVKPFKGTISDVRIWNVTRTPDQIKQSETDVITLSEKGLVAYWPLHDTSKHYCEELINKYHAILGNYVGFYTDPKKADPRFILSDCGAPQPTQLTQVATQNPNSDAAVIDMTPSPNYDKNTPPPPPPPPSGDDMDEAPGFAVAVEEVQVEKGDPEKIYESFDVQKYPSFPGGEAELMKYLSQNIQYPAEARKNNIQGTVALSFIVEKDGSISNIKILKDPGAGCGQEAVRVMQSMPRWSPGEANGFPVRTRFLFPVRFSLN